MTELSRSGCLKKLTLQTNAFQVFTQVLSGKALIVSVCLAVSDPWTVQWLDSCFEMEIFTSMLSSQVCRLATASSPRARFQMTTYRALSVKKHWLTVLMLAGPPTSHTLNTTESLCEGQEHTCQTETEGPCSGTWWWWEFLTLLLLTLGFSSSQMNLEMLHTAGVKLDGFPVSRASRSTVFPCLGGPTTSIFSSLQGSAFRRCARRKARTDPGPEKTNRPQSRG